MLIPVVMLRLLLQVDGGTPCQALYEPPPGAVKLCDEHVSATTAEIHWTSWAVTTEVQATFERYRQLAVACKVAFVNKPPLLSIGAGDQRLSVHAASDTDFPACATKARAGDRSVIVISQKHDR